MFVIFLTSFSNNFVTEKMRGKCVHLRSVLCSFFVLIFVRKNTRKNACTAACTDTCTDVCAADGRRSKEPRTRAKRRELSLSSKDRRSRRESPGPGLSPRKQLLKVAKTRRLLVNDKAEDRRKEGSPKYRNFKL